MGNTKSKARKTSSQRILYRPDSQSLKDEESKSANKVDTEVKRKISPCKSPELHEKQFNKNTFANNNSPRRRYHYHYASSNFPTHRRSLTDYRMSPVKSSSISLNNSDSPSPFFPPSSSPGIINTDRNSPLRNRSPCDSPLTITITDDNITHTRHQSFPTSKFTIPLLKLDLDENADDVDETICTESPVFDDLSRRNVVNYYENQISCICDYLYIGSDKVAKECPERLKDLGITHVINATLSPSPIPLRRLFLYLDLCLVDHEIEDLSSFFYEVCDFIDNARKENGKIFIHCHSGISRSPSLAIAYLIFSKNYTFEAAFQLVRTARRVANPNLGFTCQLMEWRKRLSGLFNGVYSYSITLHSENDPKLIARPVDAIHLNGFFIIRTDFVIYLYENVKSSLEKLHHTMEQVLDLANTTIRLIQSHEHAPSQVIPIDVSVFSKSLAELSTGEKNFLKLPRKVFKANLLKYVFESDSFQEFGLYSFHDLQPNFLYILYENATANCFVWLGSTIIVPENSTLENLSTFVFSKFAKNYTSSRKAPWNVTYLNQGQESAPFFSLFYGVIC